MTDESRLVVLRAWRNGDRQVIRMLAGAEDLTPSRQWFFADIDAVCRQIGMVLHELDAPPQGPQGGGR